MATARYIFIKDGRVRLNTNGTLPTTRECACECPGSSSCVQTYCYTTTCLWDPTWSVRPKDNAGASFNSFTLEIDGKPIQMYCHSSRVEYGELYDDTDRKYNQTYKRYLAGEISYPMFYDPDADKNEAYGNRSELYKEWQSLLSAHSKLENAAEGTFAEYLANPTPENEAAWREASAALGDWESENLEKIPEAEERYASAKHEYNYKPAEEASEYAACALTIECISTFRNNIHPDDTPDYESKLTIRFIMKPHYKDYALSTEDCNPSDCSNPHKTRTFENVTRLTFSDTDNRDMKATWTAHTDKNVYLKGTDAEKVAGGVFPLDFSDITLSASDPYKAWIEEEVNSTDESFITKENIDNIPAPHYYLINTFACGFKQGCDGVLSGEFFAAPEVDDYDGGFTLHIFNWSFEPCVQYPCGSGGSGGGDWWDSSEPESTSDSESESESSESSGSSSSSGGLRPSHSRSESESESKNPCDIYPLDHTIYFTIYVTMSDVDTGECFYDFSFAEEAVRREDYGCSVSERDGTFELYYQSEYVGYYVSYDIETGEFVRGRIDTYNFPPIVAEKPEKPDCHYSEYAVIEIY